jgi:hypothetical protein
MPSSEQMFAAGQHGPIEFPHDTSETNQLAAPMFPNIVENPDLPFGPDAEELERQKMESVRFSKGVKLKEVHVHTFDLSDEWQVEEYKKVQKHILTLLAQQAAHVTTWQKIHTNDPVNPRFIVHLDYIEYGVEKKDHATGTKTLDGQIVEDTEDER